MAEQITGILYGVGVGPGDPEEMTLKAVRILKECNLLILPESPKEKCISYQIAIQSVPELQEKELIELSIPMTRNQEQLQDAYTESFKKIEPFLKAGRKAAFLTIGDPTVYSTFQRLQLTAIKKGYRIGIISGITSFCASAAALNISLTKGNEEMHILPGRQVEGQKVLNGTEVYMKSGREISRLKKTLQDRLDNGEMLDVYGVSNCGLPNQNIAGSIKEIPEESGYLTTVIVKKQENVSRET